MYKLKVYAFTNKKYDILHGSFFKKIKRNYAWKNIKAPYIIITFFSRFGRRKKGFLFLI